ncbi:MAG TPA: hypothetical protein GX741_00920 [Erysipelothrix sp.]|nr:hypothetical protein [Erysipelothrix sp.]
MNKTDKPVDVYKEILPRLLGGMFLIMAFVIFVDAKHFYTLWQQTRGQEGHVVVAMLSNRFVLHNHVPHDLVIIYAVLILLLAFSLLYISINFFSDDINAGFVWLKNKILPEKWRQKKVEKPVIETLKQTNTAQQQAAIEEELTQRFMILDEPEEEKSISILERAKHAVLTRPKKADDRQKDKETEKPSILNQSAQEVEDYINSEKREEPFVEEVDKTPSEGVSQTEESTENNVPEEEINDVIVVEEISEETVEETVEETNEETNKEITEETIE